MTPARIAEKLKDLLGLDHEPVALSFLRQAPEGVPRFEGRVPSGCSFWRRAERGSFYTLQEDHLECPIGTLTMGFEIPASRREEARTFFANLCDMGYVSEEECAGLPQVPAGHRVVLYGPLREARATPDAVLASGRAIQAMFLFEAGKRLGMSGTAAAMGRPTCTAVPQAMERSSIAVSFGCIGARVYVGLGPEEMLFALPGARLEEIVEALEKVRAVNGELERFHHRQREELGGPPAH